MDEESVPALVLPSFRAVVTTPERWIHDECECGDLIEVVRTTWGIALKNVRNDRIYILDLDGE